MYTLIKLGYASMYELKEYYSLEEALKLYAFFEMENDVQEARLAEMKERSRG